MSLGGAAVRDHRGGPIRYLAFKLPGSRKSHRFRAGEPLGTALWEPLRGSQGEHAVLPL